MKCKTFWLHLAIHETKSGHIWSFCHDYNALSFTSMTPNISNDQSLLTHDHASDPKSKGSGFDIYSARKGNFGQEKPLISPINLAQISNPRTVLKSARPEDSKTPPEC